MAGKRTLSDAERIDWLRLVRSEAIGPRTFHALLEHCGSAGAALAALPGLAQRGGAAHGGRICSRDEAVRELESAERMGVRYVAAGEADYPERLRAIDDAPPLLAVRGEPIALAAPMVAIVGSRNASAAGLKIAERLARDLGTAGFFVVSGLARGIDAAAHRASLETGTVAVMAGGHDRIYPPQHHDLLQSILRRGAAVSEMPMGWEPRPRDFPRRNRLISGLALAVVIVEAAQRSGSLITARMALEQGREVFAVPGSPLDPRNEGSNNLLKQGATLATTAADIAEALRPILGNGFRVPEPEPIVAPLAEVPAEDIRGRILELLGPSPVSLDDLVRLSGGSAASVRTALLELDLAGQLDRHGGGQVSLRA